MQPIPEARFGELVGRALDSVPDDLWGRLENVAVVVEDRNALEPALLGVYHGVPLPERSEMLPQQLPDRIAIYRLPLCRVSSDEEELVEQVRVTVLHEIAHHLGIDHDRLEELGYA